MSNNQFAPTIWTETLRDLLEKEYIGVAHCDRQYEGEIRECGDTVRIGFVNPVIIGDYEKNLNIDAPESLSRGYTEIVIDQAKYFNFYVDDIDRTQTRPDFMKGAMRVAAELLKDAADKHVYELCHEDRFCQKIEQAVDESTVLDAILSARTKLMKQGISSDTEIYLEVSPEIAELIFKAKLALSSDNSAVLENGYLGSLYGCKVYVSNNIPVDASEETATHYCIMRTKKAIAFAEQLSEVDAYRPENRFADAVKGLHLYGARIVDFDQLVHLRLTVADATASV